MEIDSGNTAWMLASAALVLFMTPGLAFFYAGMVRSKNVLSMLLLNFVCMGVVTVLWVIGLYSLAFGNDTGAGLIGDLSQVGLRHMQQPVAGYAEALAQTIPPPVFVAFQLTFAILTPALISGAVADRVKFGSWVMFVALWATLVYAPVAHWVFSPGGWLIQLGALDFAGGTVVHANAGAAALGLILVLGRRRGWPKERMRPHNLPLVLLGTGILWFGWYGFNAGSALGAGELAGYAWINTTVGAAAAMLTWLGVEKLRDGHATTLGAASGVVAGLVAITPACGFVSPLGAMAIGAIAGGVCALAVSLKHKLGYDDALDVIGVHLVGGVLGALLIGWFSTTRVNALGVDGVFYGGGFGLLGKQALAVVAVIAYSFIATFVIAKVLQATVGLRVTDEEELQGLDETYHAESAYEFTSLSAGGFSSGGPGTGVLTSARKAAGDEPARKVDA